MKKNSLSDNNMKKGTKGFYAALGISAVMIGSACFFAYDHGGSKPANKLASPEAAVDKRADDIPKTTSYQYTVTTPVTTAPPVKVTLPEATKPREITTIPPAKLNADAPVIDTVAEPPAQQTAAESSHTVLENQKPPLADIENVINPFSCGELVKNETTGAWQTHNGTDFKAEVGTEVYAVSSGEIKEIKNDPLWGITVTLDHHNGYVTKYCGLGSDLSVQQGDTVAGGDLIGVVGNTADIESSEEPHLHLEMTHSGRFIDPLGVLKQ